MKVMESSDYSKFELLEFNRICCAITAKSQKERITEDAPERNEALDTVAMLIENNK